MIDRPDDLQDGVVLVLTESGEPSGTGFLVSDHHVLSCSHVVQLPADQFAARPRPERATVVFHATGDTRETRTSMVATVDPDAWRPLGEGDIAVLVLDEPAPIEAQRLLLGGSGGTVGHTGHIFGYPIAGQVEGLPGHGTIGATTTQGDQRIITFSSAQGTTGFSGSPLWDEQTRRVVGMFTSVHPGDDLGRLRETGYAVPSESLRKACPALELSDICPYHGLTPFEEDDSEFFYGREATVRKLTDALTTRGHYLAVLGPSGSGKSSVVRAGLVPALKARADDLSRVVVVRPETDPYAALSSALAAHGAGDTEVATVEEFLGLAGDPHVVLIIDQFEELLYRTPENVADRFLNELDDALGAQRLAALIVVMRNDFYPVLAKRGRSLGEHGTIVDVPETLDEDDVRRIIAEPAAAVGLSFEPGLVDVIVADALRRGEQSPSGDRVARAEDLPLLQFTLTQLWAERRDGQLTHNAYDALNGVAGGLARWADETYYDLDDPADRDAARGVFLDLVYYGDRAHDIPDGRRKRTIAELSANAAAGTDVAPVVTAFADRRLLVVSGRADSEYRSVEIISDSLVTNWGRLERWSADERTFRTWRQATEPALLRWLAARAGEAASSTAGEEYLLRGELLENAQACTERARLSAHEQAFIGASLELAQREEHQQRVNRIVRISLVSLLAIALTVGGVVAFSSIRQGIREGRWRDEARSLGPTTAFGAGSALVGSDALLPGETGFPARTVEIAGYSIERHEVTNEQYRLCERAGACDPPETNEESYVAGQPDWPVVGVSAEQTVAYCEWVGRRLPTDDEWERAARGTEGRMWPWAGDALPTPDRVNLNFAAIDAGVAVDEPPPGEPPPDEPRPDLEPPPPTDDGTGGEEPDLGAPVGVGELAGGSTPEGVAHLLGNAYEWTSTPTAEGSRFGLRGHGYVDEILVDVLIERPPLAESVATTGEAGHDTGFRCVEEIEQEE